MSVPTILRCHVALATVALCLATATAHAQATSTTACMFEHAHYTPVEAEAGRGAASLDFRPEDTITGLGATLTTPEGKKLDVMLGTSNGYVQNDAEMKIDDITINSLIEGYSAELKRLAIAADNPAPEYLFIPQAGFEADFQQRGAEPTFTIPDGAWRFAGCNA